MLFDMGPQQRNPSNEVSESDPAELVPHAAAVSMVVPRGRPSARTLEPPPLLCPFESDCNPHVETVQASGVAWALEHGLVTGARQAQKLDASRIAHLEALVFHHAPRAVLQLATDWTTVFCLLDDVVERLSLGPLDLSNYLSRQLSILRGDATASEPGFESACQDLRERMLQLAGEDWMRRFADRVHEIYVGFVWEETNRWAAMRPGLHTYRRMRVRTVGLGPQFLFAELSERPDLEGIGGAPPWLKPLEETASRAVGWANDLFTYEKELRAGEVHNLVFVLMHAHSLPLSSALQRGAHMHDEQVRTFLSLQAALNPQDRDAYAGYLDMLGSWMRGHLDWAEQTGRYRPSYTTLPPPP